MSRVHLPWSLLTRPRRFSKKSRWDNPNKSLDVSHYGHTWRDFTELCQGKRFKTRAHDQDGLLCFFNVKDWIKSRTNRVTQIESHKQLKVYGTKTNNELNSDNGQCVLWLITVLTNDWAPALRGTDVPMMPCTTEFNLQSMSMQLVGSMF